MFDIKICFFLSIFGAVVGMLMGYLLDFSIIGIITSSVVYASACGFYGPVYALIILSVSKKISDILE